MEQTRGAIIKAFGQLLEEKPMNKITVKDIVERCGVNRNTFYYHFRDIPALFEQMMEDRVEQLVQNHYQPSQPIECIRPMLQYGVAHRNAVLHVYRAIPREAFLSYINRMAQHFVEKYMTAATSDRSIPAENIAVTTHFFKCSIVGLLLDWLDAGMDYDALSLSQQICALFGGSAKSALSRRTG